MKISLQITSENYQECAAPFVRFLSSLYNNSTRVEVALSDFSRLFESTLPEGLNNLNRIDNFFTGEKADQFVGWYSQLLEIWKDFQQLALPFSQNMLDPMHDQKLESLYEKLKNVIIK